MRKNVQNIKPLSGGRIYYSKPGWFVEKYKNGKLIKIVVCSGLDEAVNAKFS